MGVTEGIEEETKIIAIRGSPFFDLQDQRFLFSFNCQIAGSRSITSKVIIFN